MRGVLAGLALLLLCGGALAQTRDVSPAGAPWTVEAVVTPDEVSTTLYLHLIDAMDMPINTQTPDSSKVDAGSFGVAANTLTCLDPATGQVTGGTTAQDFSRFHGYSSPSFVDYDFPSSNGAPRTWPQRGLSYEVALNESNQPVLRWYMAEDAGIDGLSSAPAANVKIVATVTIGDPISPDDKAYDAGPTLMQGQTEAVTLFAGEVQGAGSGQVKATQAAGKWVYEFSVPLAFERDAVIPRITGYTLRIDLLTDEPVCREGKLAAGTLAPFADETHQPRIEVRNREPMRVGIAALRGSGSNLTAFWSVSSGWGAYDVAAAEATLSVTGPSTVVARPAFSIQRTREHYHLTEPVEQGWTLDATTMEAGMYTAVFTVPNLQHTATAMATMTFLVHDGEVVLEEPAEAPASGALLAALAMAIAALAAARRR